MSTEVKKNEEQDAVVLAAMLDRIHGIKILFGYVDKDHVTVKIGEEEGVAWERFANWTQAYYYVLGIYDILDWVKK